MIQHHINHIAPPSRLKGLSRGDLEILASACTMHATSIDCGQLRPGDSIALTLQSMGALHSANLSALGKLGEICANIDSHIKNNPRNLTAIVAASVAAIDEIQRRSNAGGQNDD